MDTKEWHIPLMKVYINSENLKSQIMRNFPRCNDLNS